MPTGYIRRIPDYIAGLLTVVAVIIFFVSLFGYVEMSFSLLVFVILLLFIVMGLIAIFGHEDDSIGNL